MPPTHCGSGESAYRAPPEYCEELEGAPERIYIRPNERNAKVVQELWERAANLDRLVVKAEYPGHLTSGRDEGRRVAAVGLGISLSAYQACLERFAAKVEAQFAVCA